MLGTEFVKGWGAHCVAVVRRKADLPCETVFGDLSDLGSLARSLKQVRPAVCFHFGACTDLLRCERNPAYAHLINAEATAAIARVCAEIGAQLVYMCTDSIFDGQVGNYEEAAAPSPLNEYARSKLFGEVAVLAASARNLSIRGNIIGRERGEAGSPKLYDWTVNSLQSEAPIVGFVDVFFNPLCVATLSSLLVQMVRAELPGGCWHVGSKESVSKDRFIRLVAKANSLSDKNLSSGRQCDMHLQPKRPLNTSLRTDKIERAGILMPTIESELESLKQTL